MIQPLSSSMTKKKESIFKWIRDRVDYSQEANQKPYTFHRCISFLDCQMPCMATLQPPVRELYIRNVVDEDMKMDLEDCRSINWFSQAMKLTPVNVPRDGNCLLHAVSVAVWGVEDSRNTLRDLMLMTIKINHNFKKRWWSQLMKDLQSLNIDENEVIEQEWDDVIRSISDLDSSMKCVAVPHRFLEGIHIYILANILRRPIIIVTSGSVRSLAGHNLQENHIGGLYLPLEWTPLECCKTPIVLGYSLNHFCPLLSETQPEYSASQQEKKGMLPLVSSDMGFLLVRYLKDDEELQAWELVQSYLLVKEVEMADTMTRVPFAQMHLRPLEQEKNSLFEYLKLLKERFKEAQFLKNSRGHEYTMLSAAQQSNHPFYDIEMNSQTEVVPVRQNHSVGPGKSRGTSQMLNQIQHQKPTGLCITEGCSKQGRDTLSNLCFDCYKMMSQANISEDKNVSELISENTMNTNEGHAIIPTAPPMSLGPPSNVQLLSMMAERCINGCGYRCSRQTYPYCHECSQPKTQVLGQNVIASAPSEIVLEESRSTEGGKGVSDPETSDTNHTHPVLPSSTPVLTHSISNSSPLTISESPWLLESEDHDYLFNFINYESKQLPKSGFETLVDTNCKYFEHCSGVKMLDHDICFSCAKNRKNVINSETNVETETQLPVSANRPGDRTVVFAAANAEGNLESLATSFAEINMSNMSGDIEVSEEPTCKVGCPYCGTLIFPQEKLCSRCKDILQKGYKQKHEHKEMTQTTLNTASNIEPQKVKTSHTEKARFVQGKKYASKLSPRQEAKHLETSTFDSKLAQFVAAGPNPPVSQGKHCVTAGCPNYGDPMMEDKCSPCYYASNPSAKPQSALGAEKKSKSTSLYPRKDVNKKLSHKQLSKHSVSAQETEQVPFAKQAKMANLVYSQYSSGAKTAPVNTYPSFSHLSPSRTLHTYSQRIESPTPEPSLKLSVMVTSKTGHSSLDSLHALPEHSSYSFNQNPDKSFQITFQGIEENVKKNVKKCLSSRCRNYGNSYNKGYCNSCFKVIRRQRVYEEEAKYGIDVPDSQISDDT